MTVGQFLTTYAAALVTFLAVDLLWIGVVANAFYQKHLGHLLRPDVQWVPAIVFYLLFIAAILVFAVLPGLQRASLGHTLLLAAFFGLVAYATYDLTNLALTKDFPAIVAYVDMGWGMAVSSVVATVGFLVGRWVTG